MKRQKIVLLILFFSLNLCFFVLGIFFEEMRSYQKGLEKNVGLIATCKEVSLSENLFSVLEKMMTYSPTLNINSDQIILHYGNEILNGPGIAFVFDQNYILSHKSCGTSWEPDVPSFELNLEIQ